MKTTLNLITFTAVVTLLLTGCCKTSKPTDSYFYVNEMLTGNKLNLFINNEYKGELPFIDDVPSCNHDAMRQRALRVDIHDRKYKFEARDTLGRVMHSGLVTIKAFSSTIHSSTGTVGLYKAPELVIVSLGQTSEVQK